MAKPQITNDRLIANAIAMVWGTFLKYYIMAQVKQKQDEKSKIIT